MTNSGCQWLCDGLFLQFGGHGKGDTWCQWWAGTAYCSIAITRALEANFGAADSQATWRVTEPRPLRELVEKALLPGAHRSQGTARGGWNLKAERSTQRLQTRLIAWCPPRPLTLLEITKAVRPRRGNDSARPWSRTLQAPVAAISSQSHHSRPTAKVARSVCLDSTRIGS
jgi:hypothetical protein